MTLLLKAQNLTKTFKKPKPLTVFENISIELKQGESLAITGKSGSGKTTLLHLLGSLEEPDSGLLEIDGILVSKKNAPMLRNQKIGFIFQSFYLLEDLSAIDNVLIPSKIARNPKGRDFGLNLLEQVQIAHLADHPAHLLSGGERQRVAIARALCNDPDLILADEPSGNLDPETSNVIADLLFSLVSKKHKALILVTHEKALADLCSKSFRLESKQLILS